MSNAAVPVQVTTSAPMTPVTVQLVSVALVVPLYGLLATPTDGVSPPTVPVLPVPPRAMSNAAVPVQVTTSAPTMPASVQLVTVALVVPSYGLVAPTTVGAPVAAVIAAVVVAVVDANV